MYATGQPKNDLRRLCTHFVNRPPRKPAEELGELAKFCEARGFERDVYGQGEHLCAFEKQVASELGFEAAVFMPSGTMAQQIALRIHADEAGNPNVGFHATCHLEANEEHAYRFLHGLKSHLLGHGDELLLSSHILSCETSLSTILIELPMRRLGGILPSWEELARIKRAARERGAKLHLDGARLWESAPYYGKSHREICQGFDSAYVSFYKGLDALAGAMLLGSESMIAQARVWLRRHGGNLYQLTPFWSSALQAFETRRNAFAPLLARARSLARALGKIPEVEVCPREPQTPMMHLKLPASVAQLTLARDRIAQQDRVWIANRFFEASRPERSLLELVIDEEIASPGRLSDREIVRALSELIQNR